MTALEKLDARWAAGGRICVELDSNFELLPEMFKNNGPYSGIRSFNTAIIRHTMDLALAYKMNLADYLEQGPNGYHALIDTCAFIQCEAPDVLIFIDGNFGDALPDKNAKYAKIAFEVCKADAMTAQVYIGKDAAMSFTRYKEKLIFFLCKTTSPDNGDFQNESVTSISRPLYQVVAFQVDSVWNKHRNCGLVVGATYPEEMKNVRRYASELPILAQTIGKQAGDFKETVRAGVVPGKGRLLVNEGRSIIFAPYDKHEQKHGNPSTFALATREKLVARTAEYNDILELKAA